MSDAVTQADKDAQLLVEAFVLGQQDASIWQLYMQGWANDVERRIRERWTNAPERSGQQVGGAVSEPGAS